MCEYTVERAAANLPQSTHHALFDVTGGRVQLTGILGEATAAVQNQANSSYLYLYNGASQTMQLSIQMSFSDFPVGFLISGASGGYHAVVPEFLQNGLVVPSGRSIHLDCAASNTGQIKWMLMYKPVDPGAKVVAV